MCTHTHMDLTDDILGRLVALSPYEFLGVSHGLNAAACASLDARRVYDNLYGLWTLQIDTITFRLSKRVRHMLARRVEFHCIYLEMVDSWSFCKSVNGKAVLTGMFQYSAGRFSIGESWETRMFERIPAMFFTYSAYST